MTLHPPMLDVHASWIDLPGGADASATWRWFNLRSWIDAASYETLLQHFVGDDSTSAPRILDMLTLAAEAITRSGAAAGRCMPGDVEWARRTGLALFGSALRQAEQSHHGGTDHALRALLPFLPPGERQLALLALPRESAEGEPAPSAPGLLPAGVASRPKIRRLLDLCRARVESTSTEGRSA
jgi:hypothetical protein